MSKLKAGSAKMFLFPALRQSSLKKTIKHLGIENIFSLNSTLSYNPQYRRNIPLFVAEIPSFLSHEECDHIISLAKKISLYPSVISRDQFRKKELEKAMQEAGTYS